VKNKKGTFSWYFKKKYYKLKIVEEKFFFSLWPKGFEKKND